MLQITSQADLSLENIFEHFEGCEIDSLKLIVHSNERIKFLKILRNAQEFIEWLQRETKSILVYCSDNYAIKFYYSMHVLYTYIDFINS